jgi:hypothetical protein
MSQYYIFYRENNIFDDILTDPTIKKHIVERIFWNNHLRIRLRDAKSSMISSYITLKYGDELRTGLTKDYSPIVGVDYMIRSKHD